MPRDIKELIEQIQLLEEELEQRLDGLRQQFHYSFKGRRVRFENEVRRLHWEYRIGVLKYLRRARPMNVITAPVIYSMVVPIAIFDVAVTLYQHICFRAYGVPRVLRRDHMAIDRHQLAYLNAIEKVNCIYCGYGNGVISYSREILSRTEQYWCPIKHARRVHGHHSRYGEFFDYGDPEAFQQGRQEKRKELTVD
ncbi:MAG: hypothetical protein RNU03_14550 [Candidatus Sedimenticola sp. (ex Thyasira tokunagai)]